MKILSWNCRGMGSKYTISYLREIWHKHRPAFLFLSETKQCFNFVQNFQFHFGYQYLHTVDPIGRSGGLALYHSHESPVTILYSSNRIIDVETSYKGKKIFISFVYGEPVQDLRHQVWERLTRIGISRVEPWFVIGDLNEITGNHEKDGGALQHASTFLQFNNMIENCGLLEFPSKGNTLSWSGKRQGQTVRCRLDRALGNVEWHNLFPSSFVEYLGMIGSDHRSIVTSLDEKLIKTRNQFRFDKRWIGMEGLMDSIAHGWSNGNTRFNSGVVDKIVNCRHEISVWRKNNPPYGKEKINSLQKALEEIQSDNTKTYEEVLEVSRKLKEAYRDEELYWEQKCRATWHAKGDRNTKFYHALTKQRRIQNKIVGLHNSGGDWVTSEAEIEGVAVDYFNDLFSTTSPTDYDEFLNAVPTLITEDQNRTLTSWASEEEVRSALFMMHPEKAPGPDGMTALFFQQAWSIIKTDITDMVNEFFRTGSLDERINMTNICLIPKTLRPSRMTELRPISLCNVGYKIISKVLCQRLKKFLPHLISETQSAFVSGRLISDNILIAQEMFHGLRTNNSCKEKFMAIKTDMSKAYDRVEWPFVEAILLKLGFAHQ